MHHFFSAENPVSNYFETQHNLPNLSCVNGPYQVLNIDGIHNFSQPGIFSLWIITLDFSHA